MTETQLQAKCFQWAHNTFPQIRGLLFAVPNGGTRNKIEAMTLKATGTTAGIPDMILIHPLTAFEFKSDKGKLSPNQMKIIDMWRSKGIEVHIIKTVEQFKDIFLNFQKFQ